MSSEVLVEPKGRVDFKEGEASGFECSSQAKSFKGQKAFIFSDMEIVNYLTMGILNLGTTDISTG